MPIKGFTDQGFVSFPKIGDIRKGAEKGTNRPGKDLTYFRSVFPEDEQEAADIFAKVYGDEPREINVLLPYDEIERCWETWQEEHTAGALQHRCDGETCVMWRDDEGEMQFTPKPCPGECVPQGRLKVIVPELRRLAHLVVHTTSKWDIHEITSNLNALRALTRNGIKGIPLVLKRRPRKISTPRPNGKRVRQEKWMLSVEADQQWVEKQLQSMAMAALPAGADSQAKADEVLAEGRRLLHEGEAVDTVTGEVVESGPDWDEAPGEVAAQGLPPKVAAAMAFETKSSGPLGQINTDILETQLDNLITKANGEKKLTEYERDLKNNIEELFAWTAQEQMASDEWATDRQEATI